MLLSSQTAGLAAVFAVFYLKEPLHWRYGVSFLFLAGAVYFMFTKRFG